MPENKAITFTPIEIGIYEAILNKNGAVSVKSENDEMVGVKLDEFEFLTANDRQELIKIAHPNIPSVNTEIFSEILSIEDGESPSPYMVRNFEMMWVDLQLNLTGKALVDLLQHNTASSEEAKKITACMKAMENDSKYLTNYPEISKIMLSNARKEGGDIALAWFGNAFKHFYDDGTKMEWEDAFRKAVEKTMDQIVEQFKKELTESDINEKHEEEQSTEGINIDIEAGDKIPILLKANKCSIVLFTNVTELLTTVYGDKTLNQEQFNWLTKTLGDLELYFDALPNKEK